MNDKNSLEGYYLSKIDGCMMVCKLKMICENTNNIYYNRYYLNDKHIGGGNFETYSFLIKNGLLLKITEDEAMIVDILV